ncbi:MAG: hypothetical protein A2355_08905, partial [Spirochaetes bacterium RIFOXYB1_FULL_32_8]
DFIVSDPQILIGKPIIKGTRLSVDFIFELLSQGWNEEQLLTNYKALTKDSLGSVFSFMLECMRNERVYDIP